MALGEQEPWKEQHRRQTRTDRRLWNPNILQNFHAIRAHRALETAVPYVLIVSNTLVIPAAETVDRRPLQSTALRLLRLVGDMPLTYLHQALGASKVHDIAGIHCIWSQCDLHLNNGA